PASAPHSGQAIIGESVARRSLPTSVGELREDGPMSETADRYRQLAARFSYLVEAVPEEGWSQPSPCEGWSAGDVLDHVISSELGFLERFGVAPEGDDPSWAEVRDAMQDVLDDPGRADTA